MPVDLAGKDWSLYIFENGVNRFCKKITCQVQKSRVKCYSKVLVGSVERLELPFTSRSG